MSHLFLSCMMAGTTLFLIFLIYILLKKWTQFHLSLIGKIAKIIYVIILLLTLTICGSVAFASFERYLDDRLIVVKEFKGIQLGWSEEDTVFRLGEPVDVVINNEFKSLYYSELWVTFKNNKAIKIAYICDLNTLDYTSVGNISCNTDINEIENRYGESKNISRNLDKLSRIYNYPEFNVSYGLKQAKVNMLGIFDGTNESNAFVFSNIPSETILESESKILDKEHPANDFVETKILDHCEPGISMTERLNRLAAKGTVRNTGLNTYSAGEDSQITFTGSEVLICR